MLPVSSAPSEAAWMLPCVILLLWPPRVASCVSRGYEVPDLTSADWQGWWCLSLDKKQLKTHLEVVVAW